MPNPILSTTPAIKTEEVTNVIEHKIERSMWERVYTDAAGNAIGVVIGLVGGVWGLIWLSNQFGLKELIKTWVEQGKQTQLALLELSNAIKANASQMNRLEAETRALERSTLVSYKEIGGSLKSIEDEINRLKGILELILRETPKDKG